MKKLTALLMSVITVAVLLISLPRPVEAAASDVFKDAVFLGDSLTVGLEKYVTRMRKSDKDYLSNAQFLAKVGYAVAHTQKGDGSRHPSYNGKALQPQKNLKAMGAKKVFITLGINDLGGSENTIAKNYKKLITAIKKELPSAKLYMIAVFPMTARKETNKRSNKKIESLNTKLFSLAMDQDVTFIDITSAFKDSKSKLKTSLSSDNYVHLNNDGYALWAKRLIAFSEFMSKTGSAGETKATIINVKNFVNARSGPSTSKSIVTTLKKGTEVTVLESAGGNWYKVRYSGKTVYVYGKYLSTAGGDLTGTVSNVNSFANIRKGPSTAYEKAGTIRKGAKVTISKKYYSPLWYRCIYNGKVVYISSKLLKT